jgi:alpha-glucosidase
MTFGGATIVRGEEPLVQKEVSVASPDGNLRIEFHLRDTSDENAVATYRVFFRDQLLVDDSRLGLEFADSGVFSSGLRIANVVRRDHDSKYQLVLGKSREVRDHYQEAAILLEEAEEPGRRLELVFRAYDDGVAFRYRIPRQSTWGTFTIRDERTEVSVPGDSQAYALPLPSFTTSQEAYYRVGPLAKIDPDQLIGLPLLLQHPTGAWLALTEANLTDYAGLYVSRKSEEQENSDKASTLISRLSPWPTEPEVKVKGIAPHLSPWRVLMIAEAPGTLIESNLILNLNEPNRIDDPSWIRPGKISFLWWNGYVVEGEDFEGGLNTATLKHYIDFCAEFGIEYCSLDGFRDAWYGGPIRPDGPVDITTAVPEIDLPEVLRYAKEKGVRMRAWMHWQALKPQIDEAFAAYEQWGLEGIMVDFMDRDDQEMVNFYREILEKAARHRLTVNFHGSYKPTGIRRTYPNLLTREGVLNLEYNKFASSRGSTPEHELIVPFTRMLAGPLDYHQGGFRHVTEAEFQPQYVAPVVMGTRARALAMYVVQENHLPMVADYPAAYRGETGIEFLARVPATWEETRVLHGQVGRFITIARRSGRDWYVGSMTDGTPRDLSIPLDFLPEGEFLAEIYEDDLEKLDQPSSVRKSRIPVTARDTLTARMVPAGGHVIHLTPAN